MDGSFTDIFEQYYNLYRAEADTPASTDDEYTIALRLANEAVNHWASYDNTYWKELFGTLQNADDGTKTITTSDATYDAPSDMQEAGGLIKVLNSSNKTVQTYQIVNPQDAQFKGDNSTYAYFTGNPLADGYTLNLSPSPSSSLSGLNLDYVYYKIPTEFTAGADVTEMSNPWFIVHRMLANRFRVSRNPYYQSAQADAENALKKMKAANDSGTWANPWEMPDRSGSSWGR